MRSDEVRIRTPSPTPSPPPSNPPGIHKHTHVHTEALDCSVRIVQSHLHIHEIKDINSKITPECLNIFWYAILHGYQLKFR